MNWTYDSFGNRTSESFSGGSVALPTSTTTSYNDGTNHVTGSSLMGGGPLIYDGAAGDVATDNQNQYLYDGDGRLCAVRNLYSGSMTGYIYDADGNRVGTGTLNSWSCDTSSGNFTLTKRSILDQSGNQISETDGSGVWQHTNVYAAGELIATYDTAGLHYQLSDWLGTRRVETDISGNITETCINLPFGNDDTTCNGPTEQFFTGKERDTESGLDYFGARYYGSSMGRFKSPDPAWFRATSLDDPQSWNLYAYARNNPLSNIDPDGYDCVYLNDAGTDVDRDKNGNVTGIDAHSNSGECGKNHGYWVDGTFDHGTVFSNSNDVALTGHTTGSDGSQTPTDAFYTSATGHLSDIVQQLSPGVTGTVELYKAYQNRPRYFLSAQNPVDVWAGCAVGGIPSLALDLSPLGIVPDTVGALQSGSLNPLFNSGDTANNVGNAVDVVGKAADALSKTLPLAAPIAKRLGPVGIAISVYKYGRNTYNCGR